MKPAIVALCRALIAGITAPIAVALTLTTIVLPAAYQAALASCGQSAAGTPSPIALASSTEPSGCEPGPGDLPPGPDGPCPPSGSPAERGLKPYALRAPRCVKQRFPWITSMGGVGSRPSGYVSDHPRGLAVDFMIPNWNTPTWEVARWLQTHAQQLHVKYLIYHDHAWRAYNPAAGWRPYRYPGPSPGSATQRPSTTCT